MSRIHHATKAKAERLGATLEISGTGNIIMKYNGDTYEAETAKELVDALEDDIESESGELAAYLLEVEDEYDDINEGGSIVAGKYKTAYKEAGHPNTCGDSLAVALTQATQIDGKTNMYEVAKVAQANGIATDKWAGLSNGQIRMCLGNVLRSRLKNGIDVVIGNTTIKGSEEGKQKLIQAVRKYAERNYKKDGWDFLVECWDDQQIAEDIKGATTAKQAIDMAREVCRMHDERRKGVVATKW